MHRHQDCSGAIYTAKSYTLNPTHSPITVISINPASSGANDKSLLSIPYGWLLCKGTQAPKKGDGYYRATKKCQALDVNMCLSMVDALLQAVWGKHGLGFRV